MGKVFKKLGSARTKNPRAVVTRGKGKTFAGHPKAFASGINSVAGVPSSKELFNVGGLPNIPTGNVADLRVSTKEGSKILRKSAKAGRRALR